MFSDNALQARIHIVDDDVGFRGIVANYLEEHNMQVRCSGNGVDLERHVSIYEPDLVLLDLRLSQEGAFDLLRGIRSGSDVPVIIMTRHRCDEVDGVVGLELGADDYLTKPFGLRELLARVRAVLRRQEPGRSGSGDHQSPSGYSFDGWELNMKQRRLVNARGDTIPLTKGEYTLLLAFLAAPGRSLSRKHLLQATRVHEDAFDRSIDVQVLRLRRKLELDPNAPQTIRTDRGIGYRFTRSVKSL